jgi:hypothetical protein
MPLRGKTCKRLNFGLKSTRYDQIKFRDVLESRGNGISAGARNAVSFKAQRVLWADAHSWRLTSLCKLPRYSSTAGAYKQYGPIKVANSTKATKSRTLRRRGPFHIACSGP